MSVTVIAILFVALEIVPKALEKRMEELEIRGRIETLTALLRSAIILRRVLETRLDSLSLERSCEKFMKFVE